MINHSQNQFKNKSKRTSNLLYNLCFVILGISLLCPTYCTSVECSGIMSGIVALLFGWLGAFFYGGIYLVWLANPFFFRALRKFESSPKESLVLSIIALCIASALMGGGKVLNLLDLKSYITQLQTGFWLWISSIFILIIASVFSIMEKKKTRMVDQNIVPK